MPWPDEDEDERHRRTERGLGFIGLMAVVGAFAVMIYWIAIAFGAVPPQ